jgi:hypothetical protein
MLVGRSVFPSETYGFASITFLSPYSRDAGSAFFPTEKTRSAARRG